MESLACGLLTQLIQGNQPLRQDLTCMELILTLWLKLQTKAHGLESSLTTLLLKIGGLRMMLLLEMLL
jgi:hypothetical protein